MRTSILAAAVLFVLQTGTLSAQNTTNFPHIGHVDRFDPSLDGLIAKDAVIEVLCGGFDWAEGPVWVPEKENPFGGYVLFSDIPERGRTSFERAIPLDVRPRFLMLRFTPKALQISAWGQPRSGATPGKREFPLFATLTSSAEPLPPLSAS